MKFIQQKNWLPMVVGAALVAAPTAWAADIYIPAGNLAGPNDVWTYGNVYHLGFSGPGVLAAGRVYVSPGNTLTIQPGVVIKSAPGTGLAATALLITRGAQLFAEGTPERPIIFTAEADNSADDGAGNPTYGEAHTLPIYTSGLWGGLNLLGRARINSAQLGAGDTASPKEELFEGLPNDPRNFFGGDDDYDSSGRLRYIQIRYPGSQFAANREFNGLTMGAVGQNTVIEYVEVFGSSDDGFEWWGGNVNTRYLAAVFCEDDSFDTDQGYRGKNQFWFAIQKPDTGDKLFEIDGDLDNALPRDPISLWTVHNWTAIGRGASVGTGINPRDEAAPNMFNGVMTRVGTGFTHGGGGTGPDTVRTSIEGNVLEVGAIGVASYTSLNTLGAAGLLGISYIADAGLDPRPGPGSLALSGFRIPTDEYYDYAPHRGAFAPNDLWLTRWTCLNARGVILRNGGTAAPININNASIVGTVNWTRNNTYLLTERVYVEDTEVLNIEPGTVIKGAAGTGQSATALIVARGGKLFAEGTVNNPIIFTAVADDINNPGELSVLTQGLWGGVNLLGRAVINSAAYGPGDIASPRFESYEGLPTDDPRHYFGGNDDNDSSGVVKYVSIRYPGSSFFTDREFNGLTMGAVGKGTVIEYVEVFGSSDDGFEWWGGNVDSRYLVAAFCEDDSFDTDQGYRGKNQFWLAIQKSTSDKVFEIDGDVSSTPGSRTPLSVLEVFNFTGIGRQTTPLVGIAFNPRDGATPIIRDSIVDEVGTGFNIEADSGVVTATRNLLDVTAIGSAAHLPPFNDQEAAGLRSISRIANSGLDPRPALNSEAWKNDINDVTDPFYTPVFYQGAFGKENWATDFTFLAGSGVMSGAGGTSKIALDVDASIVVTGSSATVSFFAEFGRSYVILKSTDLENAVVEATIIGTGATYNHASTTTGTASWRVIRD